MICEVFSKLAFSDFSIMISKIKNYFIWTLFDFNILILILLYFLPGIKLFIQNKLLIYGVCSKLAFSNFNIITSKIKKLLYLNFYFISAPWFRFFFFLPGIKLFIQNKLLICGMFSKFALSNFNKWHHRKCF